MLNWLKNLKEWLRGWRRLDTLQYKEGWTKRRFKKIYLVDYLPTVLFLGGAVEPISGFMQRHRSGWANDKVLDIIEVIDEHHGLRAGPPLWGTKESPFGFRLVLGLFWLVAAAYIIF